MHDWNNGESSAAGETRLKRLCTSLPPRMASGVQCTYNHWDFEAKEIMSRRIIIVILHTHMEMMPDIFFFLLCVPRFGWHWELFFSMRALWHENTECPNRKYNSDFDSWNWRRIYTCITCFGVASVASTASAAFIVSTHCWFSAEFLSKTCWNTRQTVLFWAPQILLW